MHGACVVLHYGKIVMLKIGARSDDDSICMDNWLTVSQRDTKVIKLSWICFVIDVLMQSLRYSVVFYSNLESVVTPL